MKSSSESMLLVVTGVGGAAWDWAAETTCFLLAESEVIVVSAAFRFRAEGGMVAAVWETARTCDPRRSE